MCKNSLISFSLPNILIFGTENINQARLSLLQDRSHTLSQMYDFNFIQISSLSITIFIQYITFKNITNQLNIQTSVHFIF